MLPPPQRRRAGPTRAGPRSGDGSIDHVCPEEPSRSGPRMPRRDRRHLPTRCPGLGERLLEEAIAPSWARPSAPSWRAGRARAIFAEACLTVVVDNSPWLQELTLRSAEILTAGPATACPR